MDELTFRLAVAADKESIMAFLHAHWDVERPFVEHPAFFAYYFEAEGGALRFALAEEGGKLAALAGYIPANELPKPDIWVSFWVADPAVRGAGIALMAAIPEMTGCRTLACNNIRPKTRAFYEFLGFSTGRLGHFYRLADRDKYRLAVVGEKQILPVSGNVALRRLPDEGALAQSGFVPPKANPYKDFWYINRRYYHYPMQEYEVYGAYPPGEEAPRALLVARTIPAEGTAVLRIVDFIGTAEWLPKMGAAIHGLMREKQVEYADFYCAGIPAGTMRKAGFSEREEGDDTNVLPNYLAPPLRENTDYYYFTSDPDGFRLCKADGDQDRPRVDVE